MATLPAIKSLICFTWLLISGWNKSKKCSMLVLNNSNANIAIMRVITKSHSVWEICSNPPIIITIIAIISIKVKFFSNLKQYFIPFQAYFQLAKNWLKKSFIFILLGIKKLVFRFIYCKKRKRENSYGGGHRTRTCKGFRPSVFKTDALAILPTLR